jgi:hypothetical protein
MELQAKLTALEEEIGILKGEIKSILQEVRVAVLARQNPFLTDDLAKSMAIMAPPSPLTPEAPASQDPSAPFDTHVVPASMPSTPSRVVNFSAVEADAGDAPQPAPGNSKRPVDLAALMVWLQEATETFSHAEFVMLISMASYADFLDSGLKDTLFEMSEQVPREHTEKASLSDFSLALKQLEAIRSSSSHRQQAA